MFEKMILPHSSLRKFIPLISVVIALTLISFAAITELDQSKEEKPNVVFITIDSARASHFSCYNHTLDTSPEICNLAEDGYIFKNAYSPASWTQLSLSSYMTGLYPPKASETAVESENAVKRPTPIQKILRERNYTTYGSLLNQGLGTDKHEFGTEGWDNHIYPKYDWLVLNKVSEQVDNANKVLEDSSKPFYIRMHVWGSHWPYYPTDSKDNKSDKFFENIDEKDNPEYNSRYYPEYDTEIYYTDRHIGRLIKKMKDTGNYEDSIIIVSSDHGEGLYKHGYSSHGKTLYEEQTHVPLIVKPAQKMDKQVIKSRTEVMDVFNYIISKTGAPASELNLDYEIDADKLIDKEEETVISFTDQHGNPSENFLYSIHFDNGIKYIEANNSAKHYLESGKLDERVSDWVESVNWSQKELYNLSEDPDERRPLNEKLLTSKQHSQIKEARKKLNISNVRTYSDSVKERLRKLGYIN